MDEPFGREADRRREPRRPAGPGVPGPRACNPGLAAGGAGFACGVVAFGVPFTTGDPVDRPFLYVASLVAGALVGRVVAWITVVEDTDRAWVGFVGAAGYYVGLFVSAAWHGAFNLLPCAMFMMAILSAIFLAGALVALALSGRERRH